MAVKKPIQGSVAAVKSLPGTKPRTQLMFLDDLNCAAVDAFEIQPPLELLRQILSQGHISFSRYWLGCLHRCQVARPCVCVLGSPFRPLFRVARGQEMIGEK